MKAIQQDILNHGQTDSLCIIGIGAMGELQIRGACFRCLKISGNLYPVCARKNGQYGLLAFACHDCLPFLEPGTNSQPGDLLGG